MEYKPSRIPDELFIQLIAPPEIIKETKELVIKIGQPIRDIKFLQDLLFSFHSSLFYKKIFLEICSNMENQSPQIKNQMTNAENLQNGQGELILAIGIPSSISPAFYLDSFLISSKRTIDFLIKFSIKLLLDHNLKDFSLSRFIKTLNENKDNFGGIYSKLKSLHPLLLEKFVEEWDTWIMDLNLQRAKIVHNYILKELIVDTRYFRTKENEAEFVKATMIGLKKPLSSYVEEVSCKTLVLLIWLFNYIKKEYQPTQSKVS